MKPLLRTWRHFRACRSAYLLCKYGFLTKESYNRVVQQARAKGRVARYTPTTEHGETR